MSDPQIAVLIERIEHIAKGIDDLKSLPLTVAQVKTDQEYMQDHIRQLMTAVEMRQVVLHQMDKRVVILERWHKFMLAMPAIALTVLLTLLGFAKGSLDSWSDFRDQTNQRITALEFTLNSQKFQSAMEGTKNEAGK